MTKIEVVSVDSGVPIPEELTRQSWPILQLGVGESFQFPLEKRGSVQSLVSRAKKATEREFIVKKMDMDTGRVWRTK
jgi:hypothetical protein